MIHCRVILNSLKGILYSKIVSATAVQFQLLLLRDLSHSFTLHKIAALNVSAARREFIILHPLSLGHTFWEKDMKKIGPFILCSDRKGRIEFQQRQKNM